MTPCSECGPQTGALSPGPSNAVLPNTNLNYFKSIQDIIYARKSLSSFKGNFG